MNTVSELPLDKKSVDIRKLLQLLKERGHPEVPEEDETLDYLE